jgi:hypothetical protein
MGASGSGRPCYGYPAEHMKRLDSAYLVVAAVVACATPPNPKPERTARAGRCSRSLSGSIQRRSATTSRSSRRACIGEPTIGSRTVMSTTTLNGHSRQCGGSGSNYERLRIGQDACRIRSGSVPAHIRHISSGTSTLDRSDLGSDLVRSGYPTPPLPRWRGTVAK